MAIITTIFIKKQRESQNASIVVYGTNDHNSVAAASNGKTISFNVRPGDYTIGNNNNSRIYFV